MSDKTYKLLKLIGNTVLPALAALYLAIGKVVPELPYPTAIPAIISALAVCWNKVVQGLSDVFFSTREIVEKPADIQEIE